MKTKNLFTALAFVMLLASFATALGPQNILNQVQYNYVNDGSKTISTQPEPLEPKVIEIIDEPVILNLNEQSAQNFQVGDVNTDGKISEADVDFMVNDIFKGGLSPNPLSLGDLNGDGKSSTILDLNFLINMVYRTAPVIELLNPDDEDVFKTDNDEREIDFEFIVRDLNEIDYCKLIIDGRVEETIDSPQKDQVIRIEVELDSDEEYDWKIECVDIYGFKGVSSVRDFEIQDRNSNEDEDNDFVPTVFDSGDEDENPRFFPPEEDQPINTATGMGDEKIGLSLSLLQILSLILLFASIILLFAIIFIRLRR